jgi:glucose/arabinose dehydrogenase
MNGFDRMQHRLSMVAGGVLTVAVGVLLIVLGSADDAAGRGAPQQPVGTGKGAVALDNIGAFSSPVNVAFAPGQPDHTYVVEQNGTVQVLVNDVPAGTFLDIPDLTRESGEQGLLGLAFHPDFSDNGFVYAYYTDRDNGDIVVSEFETLSATDADEESRRQVIRVPHRFAGNHNGGQVLFGPDGYMYLATGDGGSGGDPRENAQDRRSLLGKLLRINPLDAPGPRAYTSPGGNPFHGRHGRDEIFARGLRNPFRFTFDRQTGRIAIGDVGQSRFEEINYKTRKGLRNANFGWDRWEGFERSREGDVARTPKRKRHDRPIFAYGRSACGAGCSVIGGVVVRDPSLTNLYGRYLFADAFRGKLRSLVPRFHRVRNARYLNQPSVGFISSFAQHPVTSEVYVTTLGSPGNVYRLEPTVP